MAADSSGPFEVTEVLHIGGEGFFDYLTVDSQSKRLYIPRGKHTQVLDLASGKVVADIPGPEGNHGVAIDPATGRGLISGGIGYPGFVAIFDLKTNAVLGKVQVDRGAHGIISDPASKRVYVSCGASGSVVPVPVDVDLASGKADPAIPLCGKPEFLASDGKGRIYVNLQDIDVNLHDRSKVAVIDSKAGKVVDKWSVAPGGVPVGMAIDPEHRRLFVGCRGPQKLIVLNTDNGCVVADVPIGAGVDGVAFDNGQIFASCSDGSLNIVTEMSAGKFAIIQKLKTPGAPSWMAIRMALDYATHTIYLPAVEFEEFLGHPGGQRVKPDSFMVVVVRPSQKSIVIP